MVTKESGEWVANLVTMTCINTTNNIIVVFENLEGSLIGRIKNIPIELVNKWASQKHIEKNINDAVREAEDFFLKVYYESVDEINTSEISELKTTNMPKLS